MLFLGWKISPYFTDTRAYSSLKSQLKSCFRGMEEEAFRALSLKCGPPLCALSQKVLPNSLADSLVCPSTAYRL